jgi:hypothetical protein
MEDSELKAICNLRFRFAFSIRFPIEFHEAQGILRAGLGAQLRGPN